MRRAVARDMKLEGDARVPFIGKVRRWRWGQGSSDVNGGAVLGSPASFVHRVTARARETGGTREPERSGRRPKSFSRSRRRCRCRRAWPSGCCCAWPPGRRCRCRRAWPPGRRCDKPPRLPAAVLDCRSAGPPPLEGSGPIASASGRWLRTRALLPSIDWSWHKANSSLQVNLNQFFSTHESYKLFLYTASTAPPSQQLHSGGAGPPPPARRPPAAVAQRARRHLLQRRPGQAPRLHDTAAASRSRPGGVPASRSRGAAAGLGGDARGAPAPSAPFRLPCPSRLPLLAHVGNFFPCMRAQHREPWDLIWRAEIYLMSHCDIATQCH
ncbi:uncharacterized protein LOC120653763 [Panicum virgatum]|uniref:uncharacterized protein LOC120653763 n=1 Tax=Panicum virgatum TaxID=38727 RepID=UPI0019D526B8|nr:uncharacterized protein LOC120653763 [Panicum virgatum]